MTRTCKQCGQTKPLTKYYDGKRICKRCCIANQLERYHVNPELHREAARVYYLTHRNACRARVRAYMRGR